MEKQPNVFDKITELGKKYELTTAMVMKWINKQDSGAKISREVIMEALIGPDYEQMDKGQRNLIFNTLILPDLDTAVEYGYLKKTSEEDEYEKVTN